VPRRRHLMSAENAPSTYILNPSQRVCTNIMTTPSSVAVRRSFVLKYGRIGCCMLLGWSACAPALPSQVARVRQLSNTAYLPELTEGEVDPNVAAQARDLLAQPLDAEAAVRIALVNNRELRAQLRELGVPAGQLLQAGLIANPTLEFELSPERDSHYEVRAEYDVSSLIMAPLRRQVAQAELEAARQRVAAAVVALGYEVRSRFYALQAAEQQLSLARRALDTWAAARDAAATLVAAGNINSLTAAAHVAAHERARVRVARMELDVAERRELLQVTLGLHGQYTGWQVADVLASAPDQLSDADVPDLDDIERRALSANLGLAAERKQLDALAKQTGVVRTQGLLPQLLADAHALRTRGHSAGDDDAFRWGAGVSVQLPLFDRGQGRLNSLEAKFDAALERYQDAAVSVRSAARDARNRLVSAHARARQYQALIVPAQRTVLEQTQLQYNAMQLGVFQLLAAQRELLDTELAQVDAQREYWTALAEVQALRHGSAVRVNHDSAAGLAEERASDDATGEP